MTNVLVPNSRKKAVAGAVLAGDTFACQSCLYNTTDRSHMTRHIQTRHMGGGVKRPQACVACPTCGKTFANAYNCRRHQKVCQPAQANHRGGAKRPRTHQKTQADMLARLERLERELAHIKQALPSYK